MGRRHVGERPGVIELDVLGTWTCALDLSDRLLGVAHTVSEFGLRPPERLTQGTVSVRGTCSSSVSSTASKLHPLVVQTATTNGCLLRLRREPLGGRHPMDPRLLTMHEVSEVLRTPIDTLRYWPRTAQARRDSGSAVVSSTARPTFSGGSTTRRERRRPDVSRRGHRQPRRCPTVPPQHPKDTTR